MKFSSQTTVHSCNDERTLVIMAKAPRPGRVKTRLAQHLPLPAITAFYRCLLDDTIALARSLSTVHVAMMCPRPDVAELVSMVDDQVQVVAQKGDGLAAGLTSVFAHFANGSRQRIIAFNSDSPHLPPSILEAAFEILTSHDVVVGPTHDGGYYLVGAKATHPTLFEADGMGTENALEKLLSQARALGLSIGFTPSFYDVDVANDLIQLATELRHAPTRAPRTAAWLAEWDHAIAQLGTRPGGM
ncbi:MAG TPA: TIGR04282 family arsenosugar biosynthesis glycosyltransferase [Candidatus Angelobacter sp.]|nr:TIGR04282 family arsenosugar biosynthesis glycosyltransferase [Candidatus Angelobacter sp.]